MKIVLDDFEKEVCETCVKVNKITSVKDLEKRWREPWSESIAYWFIRMDFIPANWYKVLKTYVKNTKG